MTIDEFIVTWFKKGLEVTGGGEALNQCVDLANGYIRDVLGLPIIEYTDAKDFPSKAGDNYDYIKNTPDGFPLFGDIVVWNGNIGGGHGHIAVALGGDKDTFVSVDENWSISQRVTIERHNYDNVDGWLHPKQGVQTDYIKQLEADRLKFWQERDNALAQLKASTDDLATSKAQLDQMARTLDVYQNSGVMQAKQILGYQQEISDLESAIGTLKAQPTYTLNDILIDRPLGLGVRVIKYDSPTTGGVST